MNKFFTSDHHFFHKKVIQYCKRPFKSVNEMNEVFIENWNNSIKNDNDEIYYIGDFSFGTVQETRDILKRLRGKKYLIIGSHDRQATQCKDLFEKTNYMWRIDIDKKISITLCHYCMRRWIKSHYNSWHLYGHSHGMLEPIGKSWDVGVDNNFTPISLDQVIEIMRTRPDNPDYIELQKILKNKGE